jgi:hypothetical protein
MSNNPNRPPLLRRDPFLYDQLARAGPTCAPRVSSPFHRWRSLAEPGWGDLWLDSAEAQVAEKDAGSQVDLQEQPTLQPPRTGAVAKQGSHGQDAQTPESTLQRQGQGQGRAWKSPGLRASALETSARQGRGGQEVSNRFHEVARAQKPWGQGAVERTRERGRERFRSEEGRRGEKDKRHRARTHEGAKQQTERQRKAAFNTQRPRAAAGGAGRSPKSRRSQTYRKIVMAYYFLLCNCKFRYSLAG